MEISGLKAITDSSNTITTWSISMLGGSLLTLLSSSYIRPVRGWAKVFYLLFVPGWLFLAMAIKCGDATVRSAIMPGLNPSLLPGVIEKINTTYGNQLDFFFYAVVCFSLWLVAYLIWWMLNDFSLATSK